MVFLEVGTKMRTFWNSVCRECGACVVCPGRLAYGIRKNRQRRGRKLGGFLGSGNN